MPAKQGPYHHGDLKTALVDASIDVIAERGVRGFSLAEASRRLGVTTAAPYRHFADRDQLLVAVAARGLDVFAAMLTGAVDDVDGADAPARRLAAMAGAYVRFAARQRPLFETLFNSGLDKSRHPELQRAWEVVDTLLAVVLEICDGDEDAAYALAEAVEASAHGYAMLLVDGEYGAGDEAVDATAAKAVAAARAIITGREALRCTEGSTPLIKADQNRAQRPGRPPRPIDQ
jgi:AcrR family transcriptional regulator